MAEGTIRSTETTAAPERVFAVAADVARYPEWATGVTKVEILETDERGRPAAVRFEFDAFIKRVVCELHYTYDEPHAIRWEAVPGDDIRALQGSYEFRPVDGGGTEIVYALRVDPAFAVPGFLRRQGEKQLIASALRALRNRAEAGEPGSG